MAIEESPTEIGQRQHEEKPDHAYRDAPRRRQVRDSTR